MDITFKHLPIADPEDMVSNWLTNICKYWQNVWMKKMITKWCLITIFYFIHQDKTIGHIGLLAICGNSVSCIVVSAIVDKLKVTQNIAFSKAAR